MTFLEFKDQYQRKEVKEVSFTPPKDPVISVLVQTYQQKDFIKECLDSILLQKTSFDFEILIGEDASTDATRAICIDYAKRYPQIIRLFLHHPINKIKVLNVNTGNFNALYNFFKARGKFIAFCEGDDYWNDPFKLQKQVNLLNSNDSLVLTYHSYQEVYENKKPLPLEILLNQPNQDFNSFQLKKLSFHPLLSTICFRNPLAKNIPEEMAKVINMDTFLLSLLGNYGGAGFLADIIPSSYRRHSQGIWTSQANELKLKSKLLTYQNLFAFYKRKEETNTFVFFQKLFRKTRNQLVYYYFKKGKIFEALKLFQFN